MDFACSSPFPNDKITHGSHREVNNVVHATGVNGFNHHLPFIAVAPAQVESEVQDGVT